VIKWGWHEKTEKTLTQIYLIGMIKDLTEQKRVERLVNLAKNWQYAPDLNLISDSYQYEGYEIKEKAYILTNTLDSEDLHVIFKANYEKPLVNPVVIIKRMEKGRSFKLLINDKDFASHRAGFEGENLVLWIPLTEMKDTSLKLLF
jgi:hypothetical protein